MPSRDSGDVGKSWSQNIGFLIDQEQQNCNPNPTDWSLSSSPFLHVSEVSILLQTQNKGTSVLQLAVRGMVTDSTKPSLHAN